MEVAPIMARPDATYGAGEAFFTMSAERPRIIRPCCVRLHSSSLTTSSLAELIREHGSSVSWSVVPPTVVMAPHERRSPDRLNLVGSPGWTKTGLSLRPLRRVVQRASGWDKTILVLPPAGRGLHAPCLAASGAVHLDGAPAMHLAEALACHAYSCRFRHSKRDLDVSVWLGLIAPRTRLVCVPT